MNINSRLLKFITGKLLCPCCNVELILDAGNTLSCQSECPLNIYMHYNFTDDLYDTLSFKVKNFELYSVINFKYNTLNFLKYNMGSYLKMNAIPSDLEFTQEYFRRKIPLWLTFS